MADTLRINELFHSIQGESTWTGLPCVFVRLAGCHLRCTYCDTEYAFREGQSMSIDAIVEHIEAWPTRLVEVTGGEPLLQERVHVLMERLCDRGWTVLLETSGACDIRPCDPRVHRIVDIKTPSSGESGRNDLSNLRCLTERDEVKLVIGDRADYEWARALLREHAPDARCRAVLFSPVVAQRAGLEIAGAPGLEPAELAAWILADGLPVRLQLQQHKIIWDPETRGV